LAGVCGAFRAVRRRTVRPELALERHIHISERESRERIKQASTEPPRLKVVSVEASG
jgi:hypothetical protein